jgi:hypothetical protein
VMARSGMRQVYDSRCSRANAVIQSSSEEVLNRGVEELASAAPTNLGIPVFVIEDFPGYYGPKLKRVSPSPGRP